MTSEGASPAGKAASSGVTSSNACAAGTGASSQGEAEGRQPSQDGPFAKRRLVSGSLPIDMQPSFHRPRLSEAPVQFPPPSPITVKGAQNSGWA